MLKVSSNVMGMVMIIRVILSREDTVSALCSFLFFFLVTRAHRGYNTPSWWGGREKKKRCVCVCGGGGGGGHNSAPCYLA